MWFTVDKSVEADKYFRKIVLWIKVHGFFRQLTSHAAKAVFCYHELCFENNTTQNLRAIYGFLPPCWHKHALYNGPK